MASLNEENEETRIMKGRGAKGDDEDDVVEDRNCNLVPNILYPVVGVP